MNFSLFLKQVRANCKFASVAEMFDRMGGDTGLHMSLRNFQLLESGTQTPTLKAFASIFSRLERKDYKEAVLAFFDSSLSRKEDEALLTFIHEHLTAAFDKTEASIWESKRPQMTYSEQQMAFLTKSHEAMRLHHRTLLWEFIPMEELREQMPIAKQLVEHELAVLSDDGLRSIRALIRTPHYENAAPSSVRKATRMLMSNLETYVSEEGGPNQELGYAIQLVDSDAAKRIMEEMKKFKKWVQSIASRETKGDLLPFVMLTFGKKLEKREMH